MGVFVRFVSVCSSRMGVFVRFFRESRVDFYVFVCHGMVFVRRHGSRAGCRDYVCGVGVISKCREAGRVSSSGGCCCCCCCCDSVATEVECDNIAAEVVATRYPDRPRGLFFPGLPGHDEG